MLVSQKSITNTITCYIWWFLGHQQRCTYMQHWVKWKGLQRINFMGCSLAVLASYTKSSKSVFQCNATITSMVFRNFAFYNKANQVHWLLKLGDSQGLYREETRWASKFLFRPKMGLLGSQDSTRKKIQLWIMSYFWARFF